MTDPFYDDIAEHYCEITSEADRVAGVEAFVDALAERIELRSAVDVACGTGLYASALGGRGVQTIGVDRSGAMLGEARRLADEAGIDAQFVRGSMAELSVVVQGAFDAVLCMGNSLPHLLTDAELWAAMTGFAGLLRPDGLLALGVMNYDRILANRERIVGIDATGPRVHVRFYDFLDDLLQFNVLTIDTGGPQPTHRLHSTTLRAYRSVDLSAALKAAGFGDIEAYADPGLGKAYDPETSDVLFLLARHGGQTA